MKCLFLISSILVGFSVMGQSTEQLDEKNGFRSFTINQDLAALKENLEFLKVFGNENAKLFKVKEPVTVNGLTGVTELIFYKDKLVEVNVYFDKTSLEDYTKLKQSLTELYGTPADETSSNNKPAHLSKEDRLLSWKGKSIGLQLSYNQVHKVTEMIYWGLNEAAEKIKGEF